MARNKSNSSSQSDIDSRAQAIFEGIIQSIVDAYNKQHGTNYTVDDYYSGKMQDDYHNGVFPNNQSDNPYLTGTGSDGTQNESGHSGTGRMNFGTILSKLSGNDDFTQFLNSLGISKDTNLSGSAIEDWNKQLLETLLQYQMTKEQRSYNENALAEQRLYDNPTNQLARLMGSGISRDAALAMISGAGAGGAGAGSALIGDPMSPATGIPASQSALNGIQGKTAIANSVFNGVQTFSSLVGLGFSIPQALSQIKILDAQAFMTDEQKRAYVSASGAFNVLSTSGVEIDPKTYGSINGVIKKISELAESGNQSAASFINNGGVDTLKSTSPYSAPFLNQLYRNEVDSDNYNSEFEARMRNLDANTELTKANKFLISEQVKLIEPQIENLRASTEYQRAAKNLAKANERLTGQKIKTEQQVTQQLSLQNSLEESFQETKVGGKTGKELYSQFRVNELYSKVQCLVALNDKESWKKEADSICKNYDNLIALYELSTLYSNGQINAINDAGKDTQDLLYFCSACQNSGLFEYVNTMANVETSGHVNISGSGYSSSAPGAQSVIDDIFKKRH